MKITKKTLAELKLCYAITMFDGDGGKSFMVATEKEGPCLRFDLEGRPLEQVWSGPGGVMTMLQVPGRSDQILSTHEFYSPNCGGDDARIVSATRKGANDWEIRTLCDLPYVHRFGVLQGADGRWHLIACTIKSACEYKEDWRFPGAIYTSELPADVTVYDKDHQLPLKVLRDGQLKNHGFFVCKDKRSCYISTNEGVYHLTPPADKDSEWTIEPVLEKAVSDICLADFDGDGKEELLTLSPFHGEELCIFHLNKEGRYELQYKHPELLPFLHAIWSCEIGGKAFAIIGHRKGERDLYLISWDSERSTYVFERVDHDRGPTNVCHYRHQDKDFIIATNRETNEVALYEVEL